MKQIIYETSKQFRRAILVTALLPILVFAQPVSPLPDPGTLPDSPFYFLKSWRESIQLFFTFDAAKKAKQYLRLAEVRLAEYQKMIERGRLQVAERTIKKYEVQLNHALAKAEELKTKSEEKAEEVSEKIREAASKHLQILQENLTKVPEAAKGGIERAIETSKERMEYVLGKKVVKGKFGGGVECRGFQGDDGVFYTLVSDDNNFKFMPPINSPFKDGESAVIEGVLVQESYCMEGVTIKVLKIEKISEEKGEIDISAWKTHRNDKDGFEFRVPPTFTFNTEPHPYWRDAFSQRYLYDFFELVNSREGCYIGPLKEVGLESGGVEKKMIKIAGGDNIEVKYFYDGNEEATLIVPNFPTRDSGWPINLSLAPMASKLAISIIEDAKPSVFLTDNCIKDFEYMLSTFKFTPLEN